MIRRLLLAALVSLTGLPALAADDKTVHIYNWSDYIAEDTVAKFEQETGYKVVYDVYDSNEVLEAKLLAGNSGYDVVVPSSNFLQRQAAAGVYLPLDKSKLPNLKNMDKGLMEAAANYDPDNEHAVIYMWGTIGIGYNAAKIKERLGDDAPVDSWSLVFDPKYAEKLKDCGITMLDSPTDMLQLALAYLGLDPLSTEADDMAKAADSARDRQALHPLLQLVAVYLRPRERRGLRLGRLLRRRYIAAARATEAENGIEIVYSLPKEGTQYWFDMMAIPADAPNPEGALAWINFIMEPQITADITNYVSYANANDASLPLVDEAIKNDPSIFPPDEVMAKLFPTVVYGAKLDRTMTRLWTKVVTGQ